MPAAQRPRQVEEQEARRSHRRARSGSWRRSHRRWSRRSRSAPAAMPSTRLPARPSRPSSMLIALTTASVANTVSGMAQWRVLIGLVPNRSPRLTRKFSPQDVISSAAMTCSSSLVPGETSPRSSSRPDQRQQEHAGEERAVLREGRKRDHEREQQAGRDREAARQRHRRRVPLATARMVDQPPALGGTAQHQDEQAG